MSPLRLLTFTTLFPNQAQPHHGVFVENRLRHLVASGAVESTVLAPIAWMPGSLASLARRLGSADLSGVLSIERRHGLVVHHPRYLVIPRVGMNLAPSLLHHAAARALRRLMAQGLEFDAIDAHYVYPDGIAAMRLAADVGKPVVITARGSDVTQLPDYPVPARMIRDAVRRADGLISVSAALGERLVALGADPARVHVMRNGIDTAMFTPPVDRAADRAALGVSGPLLVSVGHLIERKGHDRSIAAMALLADHTLLIAGEGPERPALEAQIARLGLGGRVRLLGALPHDGLKHLYGAADAMLLSSSREGWANVLLESMACGTPVIASRIPGNPEVIRAPEAGLIVAFNTPEGIADAARRLQADPPDRAATRAYAERFGWEETTQAQIALFRDVTARWASAG